MNQDWYLHKMKIEGVIRSSQRRIEHTRQMLRLSRVHIEQSQANLRSVRHPRQRSCEGRTRKSGSN